jgi:nucleoside-diphosphate-sugar epimerase
MKFLVTGGAGFIGSRLVDLLINEGHKVTVIDNFSSGKKENIHKKAKVCFADITNSLYETIIKWEMVGCDGVFHLAASTKVQESIEDPIKYNKQNVDGTLNILTWAKEAGVKRVVNSSSSAVYGNVKNLPIKENNNKNPISPYGLQKLISEKYCELFSNIYGLETVNLRYFNVFGEGQPVVGSYSSVVGIFLKQKKENESLTIVGDGNQTRDFVYVGDVATANILAMLSEKVGKGESINIGSNESISVNQIAEAVGGEKKFISNRREPRDSLCCNEKAKKLLGWFPSLKLKTWLENHA